jgi:hypothetical protein
MHNNCIYIGFFKISECRMAGELIGLLRLLRLRDILRVTIASKEFKDIREKSFWRDVIVLENNEFWKYLFTLCCSLYAPMRIFWLADQKIPAMDKLHYYVCQVDKLLAKYVKIAEVDCGHILKLDKTMENEVHDKHEWSIHKQSDNKEDGEDDVEDIDPGDMLVNYFNNGNNYDNDDEEEDDDNDRDSGNDENAHGNANK